VHCVLNKCATKSFQTFTNSPEYCLYTFVKLEMLIGHVLRTFKLLQKETPKFILPQLWPQNSPDSNLVAYSEWGLYCKRRCTKYASLIWTNSSSDWEWSGPSQIMSSLLQPFVSGASLTAPDQFFFKFYSVMCVLYTFSCNISCYI